MTTHKDDAQRLRLQLRSLVNEARSNEEKMRRFQTSEFALLSSVELGEILRLLLQDHRQTFDLNTLQLILWDPEHEIEYTLLQDRSPPHAMTSLTLVHEPSQWQQLVQMTENIRLGPYHHATDQAFFGGGSNALRSCAILPLLRQGVIIGYISLGSNDETRFITGQGTDFLSHFTAILAVCLENAINHARLKRIGLTDPLTAVNNRRFFDQRVEEEIAHLNRAMRPLSCMFLDIDFFKKVNDTYGHHIGDLVLRDVATIIKSQLRQNDVLARYGGEEFTTLLAATDQDETLQIAERIRADIADHNFSYPDTPALSVTLSIGVATLAGTVDTTRHTTLGKLLLQQADGALYEAKEEGRNRVINGGTMTAESLEA